MKNTIFYFTGTGNSLKVAQDLAIKLGDSTIVSITSFFKKNGEILISSERIGIVYPVYMWGIPKIVSKFIKVISHKNKDKFFFAVATNGGKVAGSLLVLSNKLSSRGFKLSLGFSLKLPSNFTPKHSADSIEDQKSIFIVAEKKLSEIALLIKNNEIAKIERGTFKECLLKTSIFYRIISPFIPKLDKIFVVDKNCISCGLCEKICPVQNVILKNGKPIWEHNCEMCFRCLSYCPKDAIQFGKGTIGKKRYKNPFIKVNDF
ncbi:EFR1 family ferrodoxin [Clostridium estertheticum]|uniref:EFR1 family ferrodoxin n=1 Tax=Clostridium estertheticum TaxID=238834 RepID=UPI001CF148A1|nr:EFR1 family ferrodoxin [Clostridium estertheticum]MCB2358781.1 EFR1 family ferrodoxin [Clostridium estertheticum]